MFLVQRVKDILFQPTQTWHAIVTETSDARTVFGTYVVPLAALAALAAFIGLTVVGVGVDVGGFDARERLPLANGLVNLAAGFLLSLATVYGLARAIDALATSFGARKSPRRAMMLVGYASTAAFIGAMFSIVPALSGIGLLVSLYSIFLLYTGLPVLMRCPRNKVAAYTAIAVACAIVLTLALAALLSLVVPPVRQQEAGSAAPATPASVGNTPAASATPPGPPEPAHIVAMTRNMQAAKADLAAARKAGDQVAAAAAMNEMKLAVARSGALPMAPDTIRPMLPRTLGGNLHQIRIQSHSGRGHDVLGGSEVRSTYQGGDRVVQMAIIDLSVRGALLAATEWEGATAARQADGRTETIQREGKRLVREHTNPVGQHAEVAIVLANGLMVEAAGDQTDLATLKKLLGEIDLAKLEGLQRPDKP